MNDERAEESLARAVRALRLNPPAVGDGGAVVGSGPLAVAAVAVAVARGVRTVALVSDDPDTRAAARELGAAAHAVPEKAEELHEAMGGFGAHLVFECDGTNESCRLAIGLARPAGRVVLLAEIREPVTMNPNLLVFGDKRVRGSVGFEEIDLACARSLRVQRVVPPQQDQRKAE